mmetsp:Transcript_20089/g.58113  ORF Transcript_20089/g.58113 Transcript_20089/m.58113 type:complete len:323 (+) Transcript_20089:127-1095(+)
MSSSQRRRRDVSGARTTSSTWTPPCLTTTTTRPTTSAHVRSWRGSGHGRRRTRALNRPCEIGRRAVSPCWERHSWVIPSVGASRSSSPATASSEASPPATYSASPTRACPGSDSSSRSTNDLTQARPSRRGGAAARVARLQLRLAATQQAQPSTRNTSLSPPSPRPPASLTSSNQDLGLPSRLDANPIPPRPLRLSPQRCGEVTTLASVPSTWRANEALRSTPSRPSSSRILPPPQDGNLQGVSSPSMQRAPGGVRGMWLGTYSQRTPLPRGYGTTWGIFRCTARVFLVPTRCPSRVCSVPSPTPFGRETVRGRPLRTLRED